MKIIKLINCNDCKQTYTGKTVNKIYTNYYLSAQNYNNLKDTTILKTSLEKHNIVGNVKKIQTFPN